MAMPMGLSPEGDIRTLDEVIEEYMLYALRLCKGNTVEAARLLDIGRSTLYRRMKKIHLDNCLKARRSLE